MKKPSFVKNSKLESSSSETEDSNGNDDGPDSESGSEQSPKSPGASDFTIKPIVKPMDAVVDKPKTALASKPTNSKPTAAKAATKRPAETDLANGRASKSPKKPKQSSNGGVEEDDVVVSAREKKAAINRLWREDDEIAILKGMLEFQSRKGPDFSNDAFYEFVKGMLRADVSKNQLMDKVRRLRKKYKDNADRSEDGKDPVFSKPHEHKSFTLSKKIWGGVGGKSGPDNTTNTKNDANADSKANAKPVVNAADDNATATKSSSRSARKNSRANSNAADAVDVPKDETVVVRKDVGKVEVKQFDVGGFAELYPFLSDSLKSHSFSDLQLNELGLRFWEKNLRLVGKSRLEELDAKWKQLKVAETELFLKRMELIKEGTSLILNGIKSSEN
ncbi:hypothetical protein Ancab_007966 [Ancistrocladus abbreviatus]